MTAHSNPPAVVLHGGPWGPPTVLGQASARIPTTRRIRADIKVMSKRAGGQPRACAIYERGLRDGLFFGRIEQARSTRRNCRAKHFRPIAAPG